MLSLEKDTRSRVLKVTRDGLNMPVLNQKSTNQNCFLCFIYIITEGSCSLIESVESAHRLGLPPPWRKPQNSNCSRDFRIPAGI